jgi:hypothetical protein
LPGEFNILTVRMPGVLDPSKCAINRISYCFSIMICLKFLFDLIRAGGTGVDPIWVISYWRLSIMSPHLRALRQSALATMLGQWGDDVFWSAQAPAGGREAEIESRHSGFADDGTIRSRRSGDADENAETTEDERLAI